MKREVKYRNYNRTLTVALLGDYSQNVPKPKRTQVKTYLSGAKFSQVRSKLTQVESKRTHCVVKMYP